MGSRINIKPYLRQFYRGNILYLVIGFLQTLLVVANNLLISWLLQQIVDLVGGRDIGMGFDQILMLAGLSLLITAAVTWTAYLSRPRFIAKASAQYKNYVFSELSRKGINAFSGENSALYTSALSNDVRSIENGYLGNLFTLIDESALCAGALIMMFWYDPMLTCVSILLAAVPLVVSVVTGNFVSTAEKQVSDRSEAYMSTLRDSLAGFSVIKSFRAEKQMCKLFAQQAANLANAQERRGKLAILVQGCAGAAGIILQIGVFLIGAYLALSGRDLSAGTVLIFVQLLNFVISPIGTIPQALAECKASKALITKLAQALSENIRQDGLIEKTELTDAITLRNLSYGYEPGKEILHDVSFRFEAGKSYCIVGASGSGKSTLLNLLLASSVDFSGEITYDGVPVQELSAESLYGMVSLVQQNVFVFNASIRENVTMFSDFPEEEIQRAVQLSGLRAVIAQRGADALCGENGSALSGGEKQRISIARSLLKNAQVLLADEATASLDAQTAYQVSSAVLNLHGMTRIVVTHDLDARLLSQYDCIVTMKNGRIMESGSFHQLLDQKGYFYSLFTLAQ